MNPLRLLIVTSRYWPLADDTERGLAALAESLRDVSVQSTILTAAWGPDWPCHVMHREVPVHRIPYPPQGGWHTLRYLRRVSRWLRDHRGQFDVVYVANLRTEAYTAVGTLRGHRTPVVLRGGQYDAAWQQDARFGRRIAVRCQQADAVIVSTSRTGESLIDAGYQADRIHQIPWGVSVAPSRTSAARIEARRTLSAANHDLSADDVAPVVVCVARLDKTSSLRPLIAAWETIASRWPGAKLWLIGDGPHRHDIYDAVVQRGLNREVCMPGSFDELGDLFQAVDLCVAVNPSVAESPAVLQALGAGLPIVADDTSANREVLRDRGQGLLVPCQESAALATAISAILETPALAASMSEAGQSLMAERFSLATSALLHRRLFDHLVDRKRNSS